MTMQDMPNKRHAPKMVGIGLLFLCLAYAHTAVAAVAYQRHSSPSKKTTIMTFVSEAQLHMPQRFSRSSDVLFGRKPMPLHRYLAAYALLRLITVASHRIGGGRQG